MVVVEPQVADSGSPTTSGITEHPQHSLWRRLEEKWDEIQVGRQGSYSVERLESLHLYCKSTSRTRAILVCLVTPLPALLVAVLLECLPLRPPSEGWAANWVFWLRFLLNQVTLGVVTNSQITRFVPGLEFPVLKRIVIAAGSSMLLVGTFMLTSRKVGFPVPFMMQFVPIPVGIYISSLTRLILGPALFVKDSPFKVNSDHYNRYFFAFMTLCSIFPIYKVIYDIIPVSYRGSAAVILPIWKFAAKRFLVGASRAFEDIIPSGVAFSVDYMSTLFIAVCMSTSGSIYLSLAFIVSDLFQMLLEFRELNGNSKTLTQIRDDRRKSQAQLRQVDSNLENMDLLTTLLDTTRNFTTLDKGRLDSVRLWACLPHPLTSEQYQQLQALETSTAFPQQVHSFVRTKSQHMRHRRWLTRGASIPPAPISPIRIEVAAAQTEAANECKVDDRRTERSVKLVQQGLSLLFHCEYMALVEYVECIVPMLFLVFKSALEQLPNVVYYPGGPGGWSGHAAVGIVVFAAMELGSLFALEAFLQRKFAFSPVYQLAFVFETEIYSVQTILFAETLNVLQYELAHLGADFTLRFEWLQDKNH